MCAEIAKKLNEYTQIYYHDDNKSGKIDNIEILNIDIEKLIDDTTEFFIAIGDNHIRKKKNSYLLSLNAELAKLIDPTSIISLNTEIGCGTVIMPNVVLNSGSKIGKGVIINTSSVIEHDCNIGDFVHISPGAVLAGNVTVNELSWIGANATVIQNKIIGKNTIIGAGSVVTKEFSDNDVAYGIPAKSIHIHT